MILGTQGGYDPDAPEGASSAGSQYVSKKDAIWVGGIILALGLIFWPVYVGLKEGGQKATCAKNFGAIQLALQQYAALNTDRLPPIYDNNADGTPTLLGGAAITWVTRLQPYLSARANFVCPSADSSEHTVTVGKSVSPTRTNIDADYGMYVAMSAYPVPNIASPSTTAVIAETSNAGSMGTYNPVPFRDSQGQVQRIDGFIIGYDDDNFSFSPQTKSVTRLAFHGTASGNFGDEKVMPRHSAGIHVLYADGRLGRLQPTDARVTHLTPNLTGTWANR